MKRSLRFAMSPAPHRSRWRAVAVAFVLAGCAAPTDPSGGGEQAPASTRPVATAADTSTTVAPPPAPRDPSEEPWIARGGTTTLGFGILRLAPGPGRTEGTFRIRYLDWGDGGYSSNATNGCIVLLPGDVFATSDAAYADSWLGFDRVENVGGSVEVSTTLRVTEERSVLVAYGPWDGADVGRPPSDRRTYSLFVEPLDGGNHRWTESEAGEMVTTNWTRRPEVRRGGPVADPRTGKPLWIETRILVLYDPKNARAATAEVRGAKADAMPLRQELFETLERVPLRWR